MYPILKDIGTRIKAAVKNVEQSLLTLTCCSNGPRTRPQGLRCQHQAQAQLLYLSWSPLSNSRTPRLQRRGSLPLQRPLLREEDKIFYRFHLSL